MTNRAPTGVHRRRDPLRDAWILVSPGRGARPWRGEREAPPTEAPPPYDPTCQLCPGNVRASGARNDAYDATYVFDNDFPALQPDGTVPPDSGPDGTAGVDPRAGELHRAEAVTGRARVICFSPRHDRSLGQLPDPEIRRVVDTWADESADLGATYPSVQVFENRGEAMGASNPHPHGQIWAASAVPAEVAREDGTQRAHHATTGRALLDEISSKERDGELAIESAGDWLAIVPFWAAWPFETLILGPVRAALPDLDGGERDDLARLLGRLLRRYDGLFDRPFPYSMGWHQAPVASGDAGHWRVHAHVYPPLLRADARKFMVGYELLAEPQRDLTPEEAAERLRAVSTDAKRDAAHGTART